MRLSGDRRSTVCAGQCRGSNSSESGLLTARKRVTVGGFVSALLFNLALFVPLPLVLPVFLSSIHLKRQYVNLLFVL